MTASIPMVSRPTSHTVFSTSKFPSVPHAKSIFKFTNLYLYNHLYFEFTMPYSLYTNENNHLVQLPLAGVDPQAIEVFVEQNELVIKAKRTAQKEPFSLENFRHKPSRNDFHWMQVQTRAILKRYTKTDCSVSRSQSAPSVSM